MHRIRRYIFNTLTAVSLLLLLVAVGLWVDGYWRSFAWEHLSESEDGNEFTVFSGRGIVFISESRPFHLTDEAEGGLEYAGLDDFEMKNLSSLLSDFGYAGFGVNSPDQIKLLTLPHWFLTLVFTILPAIWLYKWNKHRKLGPNVCQACGYDLMGNETGVCPECGASTADSASEPA